MGWVQYSTNCQRQISSRFTRSSQATLELLAMVETLTEDCITPRVEATSEFINLLYDLYESLPGSDVALKEPVCRRIAVSRVEEKFFKQLMPVMQKHGSLAI
ncbi:hypothetical protein MGG_15923 [Pyricularia oryzae 70-15]|uniref:Uncharacterized protein n=1 Tax=Pyricularia oryzae (strain 70-15 / ATCC MYA-4617 / FGSC 8958) TaxID=242507 RepID=G4MVY5_PYRO7|nr:uncharacterized protein MGG_15923 [Pyricularia oryzae 70-15]EHA55853.1 hypothetical protein MGG_15923 [Pyricularia oryzae 70-15]